MDFENSNTLLVQGEADADSDRRPMAGLYQQPTSCESDLDTNTCNAYKLKM